MGANDLKNIAKNGNNVKVKIYNNDNVFYSSFWIFEIIEEDLFYKVIQKYKWFNEESKNFMLNNNIINLINK